MKTKLKRGVYIVGFKTQLQLNNHIQYRDKNILYEGETSLVPSEIFNKICDFMFWDEKPERKRYYNYGKRFIVSYPYEDSKESILSACKNEWCLIYRNKK